MNSFHDVAAIRISLDAMACSSELAYVTESPKFCLAFLVAEGPYITIVESITLSLVTIKVPWDSFITLVSGLYEAENPYPAQRADSPSFHGTDDFFDLLEIRFVTPQRHLSLNTASQATI